MILTNIELFNWLHMNRHNAEMEKELMKMHRDSRSTKGDREKVSNDTRKKKKEHLARCNASFQPTAAGTISDIEPMVCKLMYIRLKIEVIFLAYFYRQTVLIFYG